MVEPAGDDVVERTGDRVVDAVEGVRPPVIVAGMHRSGTSLVVRLLDSLGVHLGRRRDPNGEALLFLGLNRWLLAQAGARWDQPGPVRHLVDDPELRALTTDHLRKAVTGRDARGYVGWWKGLRGGVERLNGPWGWKDPRNTFTLPFWLDLFPEARVVEVRRHGVDVAASLRRRTDRTVAERRRGYERRAFTRLHRGHGFTDSSRTRTLDGGFSLWEEYVAEGERQRKTLGGRWLALRFEELVAEPGRHREALARFLELPEPEGSGSGGLPLPESSGGGGLAEPDVRPGRAFSYRGDPELTAYAHGVAERLRRWGYDP